MFIISQYNNNPGYIQGTRNFGTHYQSRVYRGNAITCSTISIQGINKEQKTLAHSINPGHIQEMQ